MAGSQLPAVRAKEVVRALEKAGFNSVAPEGESPCDVPCGRPAGSDGSDALREDCSEGNIAYNHSEHGARG